jgi:hypothetical protein
MRTVVRNHRQRAVETQIRFARDSQQLIETLVLSDVSRHDHFDAAMVGRHVAGYAASCVARFPALKTPPGSHQR